MGAGFLPDGTTYGMHEPAPTNGSGNGGAAQPPPPQPPADPVDTWTCSDKQKTLILSLVEQHGLDKKAVEALSKEMFGLPVKTLNRLQASGLIEELLARHGKGQNGHGKAKGNVGYHRRTSTKS